MVSWLFDKEDFSEHDDVDCENLWFVVMYGVEKSQAKHIAMIVMEPIQKGLVPLLSELLWSKYQ